MRRSTNRSTVVAPMSSYPVTVRNIVKSVGAYVRGERRRGLPRLDMRVECDAPNAPNMRGRQRLGEWYPVSTSSADGDAGKAAARPSLSVTQLLAAKGTRPIRSLDELAADTFESDEEVEEFLAFTYAERHRDLA